MTCDHGCCPTKRDHWLSIGVGASAMPTRKASVAQAQSRDRVFSQDAAAYRRLRRDGIQPAHVDGSAVLEARASTREEIERGRLAS